MKANRKIREDFVLNRDGYSFIVPMTIAIVIGFALLIVGAYVVGTLGSALEDTYETNVASGSADTTTWNNRTGTTTAHSLTVTLPIDVCIFNNANSRFYILANGSSLDYDLNVNGQMVNTSSNLTSSGIEAGHNTTFAYLLTNNSVNATDTVLNFQWNITGDDGTGNAMVQYYVASYYKSSDYRSANENKTVYLLGNVTDGFSSVVDIEIVVIIITALSMAIITIMAVGSRKQLF